MQQRKEGRVFLLAAIFSGVVILACAVGYLIFYRRDTWADRYVEKLKYNFDDTAVNKKMKRKEWRKPVTEVFEGSYDFDKDGQAEPVLVTFSDTDAGRVMEIAAKGETLRVVLDPEDAQRAVTVVGIRYGNETYLAAVESVYKSGEEAGRLRWKIYRYQSGAFVLEEDFLYTGIADGHGIMTEGTLESYFAERKFSYDLEKDQNDYIYYRSVVFADMKDMGIRLPFETRDRFETFYKRNIRGIFNVVVE